MVLFQELRIGLLQLQNSLVHARQMLGCIAVCVFQTDHVIVHQRTVGVEIKTFVLGVVTERVKTATEWFLYAHGAALGAQVIAARLYANRA